MELKKWIAVGAVGLSVAVELIVRGQLPSTMPTSAPAATLPTTRPAAKPLATTAPSKNSYADNTNNNNNSRNNGRTNRRGRNGTSGNTRDNTGSSVTGSGADAYAILKTRSIFVKGNQTLAQDTGPRTQVNQGQFAGVQEDQVVFNGVILVNDEPNALVENLNTHDVVTVRPGGLIAGGRVSSITFDQLTYVANGRTVNVAIGQDLRGMNASSGYSRPAVVTPTTLPTSPSVTGTDGGGAVSPPGTGGETSATDMEAKLKARRLAESGGK